MAFFKNLRSIEDCGKDRKKSVQSGLEWAEKCARCGVLLKTVSNNEDKLY